MAVVGFVLAIPLGAAGQGIRGAVVDSATGTPVGQGFVVLLDAEGSELSRVLTDRRGRFVFSLPGGEGGRFRLRSERIAYRRAETGWLTLRPDSTLEVTLRIAPVPVRLDAIEVETETQCRLRPEEGRNTAALWEEAQKALRAASWSARRDIYTHTIHRYRRDLDARRRRVEDEATTASTESYRNPFRSLAAERLLNEGYIITERNGTWYHAPDANTLLHESFLSSHCFRAVRNRDRPGMVGLEFTPTPDRKLADVRGVLWLDQASSELKTIEYSYENLPHGLRDDRIGGTIEFLRMPSGAWIIHKWQIRMPELARTRAFNPRDPDRVELGGFRDTGGTIVRITDRDGNVVYESPDLVTLSGTVVDSGTLRPLADATVELRNTGYTASTDVLGRYELSALLHGEYLVEFSHRRLDSLGFYPEPRAVDLEPGDSLRVDLWLPPESAIVRHLCPDARNRNAPVIVGMVRNPTNGRGVADVPIVATWQSLSTVNQAIISAQDQRLETTSDVWGSYVLCDMPEERTVVLEASRDPSAMSVMTFRLERAQVLMSAGAIHRSPLEGYYHDGRIWTIDLILLPAECYDRRVVDGIREVIPTCDVSISDATRLPPRRRRR